MRVLKRAGLLLLLTLFAVLVNGYHYAVDDGAIYIPEILQHLHPSLYPLNADFFHAQGSKSPVLSGIAALAELLRLSAPWSVMLLQFLGIFTLLGASLQLAEFMFKNVRSAWAGVCLLACVLSVFVAGTSIPIMDPYFTSRTLSTPLTIFALANVVAGRKLLAAVFVTLACLVHPLMTVFAVLFIACYYLTGLTAKLELRIPAYAAALPLGLGWGRVQEPAQETMMTRSFFFAYRWTWIEWTGVVAPLAIFLALWRLPLDFGKPALRRIAGAAFLTGCFVSIFFLLISSSPNLESFLRLQPMRAFQVIYIVMFLIVGAGLGEFVLGRHVWRWATLLVALGLMDVVVDHATYPSSSHVEWPFASSRNPWVQGFDWAKLNTPPDALFALPPRYIYAPGEDAHGFRAIAERSALADELKDAAVVSIFPALAPEWKKQVDAQAGWNSFKPADFHRLSQQFNVTWVVVQVSQSEGLDCRYHNASIAVCHIT